LGAEILRVCGDAVTVTHSQASFIEVLPSGVTKAYGLARVAEYLGFDPLETIAFGDMPNDIPMLEWAGYAVAMRNGDTSVHAVAHEIGPSNDEDGVATVLERVFAGSSASPPSHDWEPATTEG
jgi:hydroxymethylpyrimidine pyrophosphatase-like HAD family hydrolase